MSMMKQYHTPITDIVALNTRSGYLDERDGVPAGSYEVEKLEGDPNIEEIGSDDANTFQSSLWEE